MTSKILIYGSLAYDHHMHTHSRLSAVMSNAESLEETRTCSVEMQPVSFGGNGGNIAYNLALLGQPPILVSTVGNDGKAYLEHLQLAGINTAYVSQLPEYPTTSVFIATDDAHQSVAFFDDRASQKRVLNIPVEHIQGTITHIAPGKPSVSLPALKKVHGLAKNIIWDPGQDLEYFSEAESSTCLEMANVIMVNHHECKMLCSKLDTSIDQLLEKIPMIIETKGKNGATMHRKNHAPMHIPAIKPKEEKGTLGAGDAFRSGFLFKIANNNDPVESVRFGCALAAIVVEKGITQLPHVNVAEIHARMA